jgi:dimethylaniline monooxygenase (N-oxide forming)
MNRVADHGAPYDCLFNTRMHAIVNGVLPTNFNNWRMERSIQTRFDHAKYGMQPMHRFNGAQVTVNDELPARIASGTVIVKPNIKAFSGAHAVIFDDGTTADNIDTILLSTGYRFDFSLIENGDLVNVERNETALYKYIYPPTIAAQHPTIGVCGLIQASGSIAPISEMQARVFFDVLSGRTKLPTAEEMIDDVRMKQTTMRRRYVDTMRHTIQVDCVLRLPLAQLQIYTTQTVSSGDRYTAILYSCQLSFIINVHVFFYKQVDYVQFMDELADMIGAKPDMLRLFMSDPLLGYKVLTGPNLAYVYRLNGPHPWSGARRAILDVWNRIDAPAMTRVVIAPIAKTDDTFDWIKSMILLFFSLIAVLLVCYTSAASF